MTKFLWGAFISFFGAGLRSDHRRASSLSSPTQLHLWITFPYFFLSISLNQIQNADIFFQPIDIFFSFHPVFLQFFCLSECVFTSSTNTPNFKDIKICSVLTVYAQTLDGNNLKLHSKLICSHPESITPQTKCANTISPFTAFHCGVSINLSRSFLQSQRSFRKAKLRNQHSSCNLMI